MNDTICGKLDSLYDGFMGLTADRQKMVVETAQSLLEAQREIELLMENTGAAPPYGSRIGVRRRTKTEGPVG
jgi:hypothetical protein